MGAAAATGVVGGTTAAVTTGGFLGIGGTTTMVAVPAACGAAPFALAGAAVLGVGVSVAWLVGRACEARSSEWAQNQQKLLESSENDPAMAQALRIVTFYRDQMLLNAATCAPRRLRAWT